MERRCVGDEAVCVEVERSSVGGGMWEEWGHGGRSRRMTQT